MAIQPIYFRVIHKDLQAYTLPDIESPKSMKLDKGEIYVAISEKKGWLKIDETTYCSASPNSVVQIPVNDVVEINGRYRVKDDVEVSGMSRRSGVDVNDFTGWVIVGMILTFIPIIIFTLFFTWRSSDSTPLTTLIGCYAAVISLVTGLYSWKKKNADVFTLRKNLKKQDLDTNYADNIIEEQEAAEVDRPDSI